MDNFYISRKDGRIHGRQSMRARCLDCEGVFKIKFEDPLPAGHVWSGPDWDEVELEKDRTAYVLSHDEEE